MSLAKTFVAVWDWSQEKEWRNWSCHGLIAIALSFVVGAWAIAVFYVLRELEEIMVAWGFGDAIDWLDHLGDAAAPVAAAVAAHLLWRV